MSGDWLSLTSSHVIDHPELIMKAVLYFLFRITFWTCIIIPPVILQTFNVSTNKIVFKLEDELLSKVSGAEACTDTNAGPVIKLLQYVATRYLTTDGCTTVILYDQFFAKSLTFQLLKMFPGPMIHGQFSTIDSSSVNTSSVSVLAVREALCRHYLVLSETLEPVVELLGHQPFSKVVLVPQVSPWQINNFLESASAGQFVNLLIVADPSLQLNSFNQETPTVDINLYTHDLYADPLGGQESRLLTAWRCDRLTRPWESLFPRKMASLNGYQMRVVAAEHPPYVYQEYQRDSIGNSVARWDGLEVRLLKMVSAHLNLTLRVQQPSKSSWENTPESVLADLSDGRADVAVAGVYVTAERLRLHSSSGPHSHDCAVFMTLASTALPKYQAIMGPFRWEVWLALTLTYLLAIVPISFSAHHTLRHLIEDPCEIENMFWYVFGTFTNCFTFTGPHSWTSGNMSATRMFVGAYWVFTIIVSAAYTGSIIAFIMLPMFPAVIDTAQQLVDKDFRLIVTNKSDLNQAIYNSTDPAVFRLSKKLKVVDNVDEAISNITDSFFFIDYAFLHSREFLKHVIRTKFTTKGSRKKSVFHLSRKCFLPMMVTMMFPKGSVLVDRVDTLLLRISQSGFVGKLVTDVAWDQQRSGTGKLLQVSGGGTSLWTAPEERQLTLDDTQGMFLLLGAGFSLAVIALVGECVTPVWLRYKESRQFIHTPDSTNRPSLALTEADSRNYQFRDRHDFLDYFSSYSTSYEQEESHAQVHQQSSVPSKGGSAQSLDCPRSQRRDTFSSYRCSSV